MPCFFLRLIFLPIPSPIKSRAEKVLWPASVEIIPIQKISKAYERMLRSDVKYRFVIDMASLK